MASQLKRDLMKLQKGNQLGTSDGFATKSSNHPKSSGKVRYHTPDVTGADRSPQTAPKPKAQTAQQRYFQPVATGKATANPGVKSVGKSYKAQPGV